MATLEASGPNAEQITYWNETAGPKWVQMHDVIDAQIEPLGEIAMQHADLRPGGRVLDVGCGCGATSIALAARVGPEGSVSGVDISATMLAEARRRAAAAGVHNVSFENADAQTYAPPAQAFDVVFSRFGVMFFEDPARAFANLRRALRSGGRLTFVCWQSIDRNPWVMVPLAAAAPHLTLPPPPEPGAPGPFAFADAERVTGILSAAGFDEIEVVPVEREVVLGGGRDLDGTIDTLLQIGPLGRAAAQNPPEAVAAAVDALRREIAPHHRAGGLRLGSASWIFRATNT